TLRYVVVVFTRRIVILGRAVAGGDVERDSTRRRRSSRSHCKRESSCAGFAFRHRYIVDAQNWTVIVLNCSLALSIEHGGAAYIRDIHKENFSRLNGGVASYVDAEGVILTARRNRLRCEILRDVIAVRGGCGAVLGRDVKGYSSRRRRRRKA